jgi:hypothetical protein
MAFSKVKNFTEKDAVRVKAAVIKGKVTNKLTIYIGGEVYDKYFGDSKSAFARIMVNDKKEININLSKINVDQRYKEYKFCITGHGTCKTRKLLVSIPDSITNDLSKYVENRTVFYCTRNDGVVDSLMLNLDTTEKDFNGVFNRTVYNIEASNKKPKKVKRKTIFHEDPISLHKKYKDKFNELYGVEDNQYKPEQTILSKNSITAIKKEIRKGIESNIGYRHESLLKEIRNLLLHITENHDNFLRKINNFDLLGYFTRIENLLLHIAGELETTSKEKTDDSIKETSSKENTDESIKDFVLEKIIQRIKDLEKCVLSNCIQPQSSMRDKTKEIHSILEKLEDKPKEDKRSLFAKVFGE